MTSKKTSVLFPKFVSALCLSVAGVFITASPIFTQSLTFKTFAGPNGSAGFFDDTGGQARFNDPLGMATDTSGNIYVADSRNHTIRRITPAGVVTTFAGLAGFAGSADGIGGRARFRFPSGVATDTRGNIYVADGLNYTIRKITPARIVTTLAGMAGAHGDTDGRGSAARFGRLRGLAIDQGGNIYVADSGAIRKITPAADVTTLAKLSVAAVAVDATGNVYVASSFELSFTIAKVSATGQITFLAGGFLGSSDGVGSAARFFDPSGLATDGAGNIYIADTSNNNIRKMTSAGVVITLAGRAGSSGSADGAGSAARFLGPQGVTTDSGGNVYVADTGNNTIRKITPSGVVTTLAGQPAPHGSADGSSSAARFNGPQGIGIDTFGNVYVADTQNQTIRKISPAGVVTTLAGTPGIFGSADGTGSSARFWAPEAVATDSGGNIYVADTNNHTIRKITPAGVVTTFAGLAQSRGSADGTGSAARFERPGGLTTDSSGNIYVADTTNCTIRRITPDGVVTTLAGVPDFCFLGGIEDGTGSAARFNFPEAVTTDSAGNVYVADTFNNTIRKITPAGVVTTLAGMPKSGGSTDGVGSAARFGGPRGLATDSSGNIYVADTGNHTIRKITPAGVVTTLAGMAGSSGSVDGTGSAARFDFPEGVAIDANGNTYIANSRSSSIRRGEPALIDSAAIDSSSGPVGQTRQLDTHPQTATAWTWRLVRRPSSSTAMLSSTSIRNPTFTPDVADLYVFQLTATNGVQTSITMVELTTTAGAVRSRPVRR